jgi:hypothetical protein
MFKNIADNREPHSLATQFRRKRFAFLHSLLTRLQPPISILDIGGTEDYWRLMLQGVEMQVSITILNLEPAEVTLPGMTSIVGDARHVQAQENSFDVVFSNSVIEHVGSYQDQLMMAAEVRRLAKRYFIQTPNKYFPIEPHFLFPLFQFLPIGIRVWLLRNFKLGWFQRTPDRQKAKETVNSIRLMDKTELQALFPQASIYEERVLGLTKSFVAYGGWDEPN